MLKMTVKPRSFKVHVHHSDPPSSDGEGDRYVEVIVLLPVPPWNECTAMLTPILFLPRYFSFLREDAVANWSLMDRRNR